MNSAKGSEDRESFGGGYLHSQGGYHTNTNNNFINIEDRLPIGGVFFSHPINYADK